MIYTDKTKLALRLCFDCHKDQVDKSGLPYVFHPFHIAEQMDTEDACCVALLHDVLEDTQMTIDDLVQYGFSGPVLKALELLTHHKETPYFDYILNIKPNPLARKIKLADLKHNSDLTRLTEIKSEDLARNEKYKKAIELLEDMG